MSKQLGQFSRIAKNAIENTAPFVWLYQIDLAATDDEDFQQLRLNSLSRQVEFGQDDEGEPLLWYPAPVSNSGLKENADGDLPTLSLTLGSSGYKLVPAIDKRGGLIGSRVVITLLTIDELSYPGSGLVHDGEITGCSFTSEGVAIEVGAFNLFRAPFPSDIYSRRKCGLVFGGARCGYDTTASGAAFTDCPGTLLACNARGEDEDARGVIRRHPDNFLAFLGLPGA